MFACFSPADSEHTSFSVITRAVQVACPQEKLGRACFAIREVKHKRARIFHIPELLMQGPVSMETLSAR